MDRLSSLSYWVTDNLIMPILPLLLLAFIGGVVWIAWGVFSVAWDVVGGQLTMVWNVFTLISTKDGGMSGVVLLIGVVLATVVGTAGVRRETGTISLWFLTIVILVSAVGLAVLLHVVTGVSKVQP